MTLLLSRQQHATLIPSHLFWCILTFPGLAICSEPGSNLYISTPQYTIAIFFFPFQLELINFVLNYVLYIQYSTTYASPFFSLPLPPPRLFPLPAPLNFPSFSESYVSQARLEFATQPEDGLRFLILVLPFPTALFSCLCGAENSAQDFVHSRQTLYQLWYAPAPVDDIMQGVQEALNEVPRECVSLTWTQPSQGKMPWETCDNPDHRYQRRKKLPTTSYILFESPQLCHIYCCSGCVFLLKIICARKCFLK